MHTFLIVLAVVLCLSAAVLIVCHFNDDNLTPVAKTFSSLFIACCALILSLQVMLDYSGQPGYLAPRLVSAPGAEQYAGPVERPAQVAEAPGSAAAPAVASVAAPVAAAPVVAQAPHEDSQLKDMLLGGALGYMAGSSSRGGNTGVTSHTTVIHEPAPSYTSPSPSPAPSYTSPSPSPAPRYAPSAPARPTVAAAPRPTFKSTFSMTRSSRR